MGHNDNEKPKAKAQPPGHVNVITSDGVRINVRASKLSASPIFRNWVHDSCYNIDTGIILKDANIERAAVVRAALDIISCKREIVDIAYQSQIDVIRFFTMYKFDDELRAIKSSIHRAITKSHSTFHPFSVFRMAVFLQDVDLCGRLLAELGGYRISSDTWRQDAFGRSTPGAGCLLASAMSYADMRSLPPAVYWALVKAEAICMDDAGAYSREFMRLMRLKDAPALDSF